HVVEVWNKIDLLEESVRHHLTTVRQGQQAPQAAHLVSAITGEGVPELLADIEQRIAGRLREVRIEIAPDGMGVLPWIYKNSSVIGRDDRDNGSVALSVEITVQAQTELRRLSEQLSGIELK
ncbi:GTPase HflX, partial [Aurantimonas sp. LRZ36]|nr:GTPase HflX [Aurantimonas marianensis]